MATGRDNQLTRQVGEHLVAAELGRRGYIATPFAGNVPTYDLLAASVDGRAIPIQVKAIRGGSWQFSADSQIRLIFVAPRLPQSQVAKRVGYQVASFNNFLWGLPLIREQWR